MTDKPFKTFDEQIEILESRKLTVNDRNKARNILSNNNYYFLTGYKTLLLKSNSLDEYKDDATFDDLYNLYKLDKEIKMLTLDVLLQIEQKTKTIMAYELCLRYGNECGCYKDITNFDIYNKNTVKMIDKVKGQVDSAKLKNKALRHYVDKHSGDIPFWVAVKVITFGTMQKMYSSLKPSDKDYISKKLICKNIENKRAKAIESFLELIVDERNACAHDEMFMNFIHNKIKIPETKYHNAFDLYKNDKNEIVAGRKDFLALLIVIKHFVSDDCFKKYINTLKSILNNHLAITTIYNEKELYRYIHLPINFEKLIEM